MVHRCGVTLLLCVWSDPVLYKTYGRVTFAIYSKVNLSFKSTLNFQFNHLDVFQ